MNLKIAVGLSADSKRWDNTQMDYEVFVERLKNPVVTSETYAQYIKAPKEVQGKIKDVGGYVCAHCENKSRKAINITERSALTLDIDFGALDFWELFTVLFDCEAVLHSTHKHSEETPRYRLIIPLAHSVTGEEYIAIARKVADIIGINLFDPTTFDINRLMFWPSHSKNALWEFHRQTGDWLDPDQILSLYTNWRDTSEWAYADNVKRDVFDRFKKQQNPLSKKGVVGAFCRAFPIRDAIAKFLDKQYTTGTEGRYTYLNGTTSNGVVIYEDMFAYSHHSTDPTCGILCNAFDLVRIHLFGGDTIDGTLTGERAPSFKAMMDFAVELPEVRQDMAESLRDRVLSEFEVEEPQEEENNTEWMQLLTPGEKKDEIASTAENISLILKHDPIFKNAFRHNEFDRRDYVYKSMPWHKLEGKHRYFLDVDLSGMRNYFECAYKIVSAGKIKDAFVLETFYNRFHPVREYLNGLEWDGKERVKYLPQMYFGCDDTEYVRMAISVGLVASVARIYQPGIKYDLVPTFISKEGTGKSSFLRKLGGEWFSDSLFTLKDKTAFEQLQGAWIIELAELSALKKQDIDAVKHFITKQTDTFRAAYKEVIETHPRQCTMWGTTNNKLFLKQAEGDRRFLPLQVQPEFATHDVFGKEFEDSVPQIWAEAKQMFKNGHPIYLPSDIEAQAAIVRKQHRAQDSRTGLVDEFLQMLLPDNWDNKSPEERARYFTNYNRGNTDLIELGKHTRTSVCIPEIWVECLGNKQTDFNRIDSSAISDMLRSLGWDMQNTKRFNFYGPQRIFSR